MAHNTRSIFIDESGDFGQFESHSPYYIVSMILHEQSIDITDNIRILNEHIVKLGYNDSNAIHVGPLIRRESIYSDDDIEERQKLFSALFHFARKLPFTYICAKVKKRECSDVVSLNSKLAKSIATVLREHQEHLEKFDQIIVYYDNGQVELTKMLTVAFNTLFSHVEFRRVEPVSYKLFQVADLICTMELLYEKSQNNGFSRSEKIFFHSARDFKKNYYKHIIVKHI